MKLNVNPGSHLSKHVEKIDKSSRIRAETAKTPTFKLHRIQQKKNRSQLKNQREIVEGTTYESNIGLLAEPRSSVIENSVEIEKFYLDELQPNAIIFFDIETGGFKLTDDILQIGCKYKNSEFNKYIKPSKPINSRASTVHGLTNEGADLYL